MAFYKNLAGQKIAVYAHDTSADAAKTGDAANITAQISKDGGETAATNDTNPTELDATDAPGVYLFDMTQAESNADLLVLAAKSSTSDILLDPVIIYTVPGGFKASATAIVRGTVSNAVAAPTATVFYSDDITEETADHYIGRVVIFTSGNLLHQAAPITDYALDTAEGKFTVKAMTEAPANDDTFIIL